MRKGSIGAIALAFIMIIGVILCLICTEKIPAGYVGVVYNMNGGIEGKTLSQGFKIVAPTKKVTLYSVGLEQSYLSSEKVGDSREDESFKIPTSDGKTVTVNLEFSYMFDPERVADTFTRFKGMSGAEAISYLIGGKMILFDERIVDAFLKIDDKEYNGQITFNTGYFEIFNFAGSFIHESNKIIEGEYETAENIGKTQISK